MAVNVVIVPLIVAKGAGPGGVDVTRPDFGSFTEEADRRGWGQASSKFASKGKAAVWLRCDAAEAAKVAAEVGGTVVGEARAVDESKGDTLTKVYREKVAASEAALETRK